jgi:hypothetical protein
LAARDSVSSSQAGTSQAGQETQRPFIQPQTRATMQANILKYARSISDQPSLPKSTSSSRPSAGGQPGRLGSAGNGGRSAFSGKRQQNGSSGGSSVFRR